MNSPVLLLVLVISSSSSHRHHRHSYGGGGDGNENTLIHPPWWVPPSYGVNQGRDYGSGLRYPDGSGGQYAPNRGGRWHPWGRPTEPPRITYPIYPPTERSTTTESLIDFGVPSGRPIDPSIESCKATCLVTNEYNPVCGTDNITYANIGRLECARSCGVAVQVRRRTSCSAPAGVVDAIEACISTCSVTPENDPVCGTNNVTYASPGQLECVRNCGVNVEISRKSSCLVAPGPNNPDFLSSTEAPNGKGSGSGNGSGHGSGGGDGSGSGSGEGDGCGSGNKNPTTIDVLACMQSCPITPEINTLCGTDGVTYGNPGKLLCAQFCGVDVRVQKFAPCLGQPIPNANVCPTLPTPSEALTNPPTTQDCIKKCCVSQELKPVCGTNGVTYINIESLLCNSQCGVDVSVLKLTPCGQTSVDPNTAPTPSEWPTQTQPTPTSSFDLQNCINKCKTSQEYKPVCGSNGVTYANLPKLQCAQRCGISVNVKSLSPCFTSPLIDETTDENSTDTNNQGFTIPSEILASVFPEYFTSTPTPPDPDESYEIDIKFGTDNNVSTKVL